MKFSDQTVMLKSPANGARTVFSEVNSDGMADGVANAGPGLSTGLGVLAPNHGVDEIRSVFWTFLTTLATFAAFLAQGILLARILGPIGRGEFGTAVFFPRDALLYAGLLGGIEVVNATASRLIGNAVPLKYSAAKLGLISGVLTGLAGAILAAATIYFTDVMYGHDKWYLLPYCLLCCFFVPFEHVQLNVSAVDRGKANYGLYNFNRLFYACAFPALLLIVFCAGLNQLLPFSNLLIVCSLFLLSRLVGLLPTLRGMDVLRTFGRRRFAQVVATEEPVPSAWRLLLEGRGFALSMLATELFERLDVLLIVALAPVVASGYYFVAVPIAAILTVGPNALGVFTFNAGADPNRQVSLRLTVMVMLATAAVQVAAAFVYSWVMPWLIDLLFTSADGVNRFAPAIPFALWLLPACAMKGFLQAADGYLKGRGRPMIGVCARVLSIVVMLSFVWVAFRFYSFEKDQQWLCIPMAACVGQAVSMVVISVAVIQDVRNADSASADTVEAV